MTTSVKKTLLPVLFVCLAVSSGCIVRKAVAVPLRVTGAVVSVVPLVGGPIHTVADGAAEVVD